MVRIITDSAADFEPEELAAMNISCIPITVILDGQEYQENVNLSKNQFYDLLAATGGAPQTAQPSPVLLGQLLEQARQAGDEAVYITLSSALSGTCQSARMIADSFECDSFFVVDSRNATGGQRLLVEYAVRLRDAGQSAAQIARAVEALREKIELYACIDTLEYLYRGGRISHTVYKLGSMAQVKPLIHVSPEGAIEVPAKAMGMRKGMDFLVKRLEQRRPSPEHTLYVMYTADRTNGEALAQKLMELGYSVPAEHIINVGAAIGSHIGPNACGLVYVGE